MEIFILVILVCAAILVGISYRIRKNKKHTGEIHSSVGKMDYRRGDSIPPKPAGETAYVFIDVETTGLNPNDDTIVQLSAVRYFGEKAVDGINTYIDPGRPIPAEATHIHGITDDIVRGAPKIGDVREPFMALIRDAVLVGYNTIFDLNFLNTAFDDILANSIYIDVLKETRTQLNLPDYKLETVANCLGVAPAGTFHDALNDCYVTASIFFHLGLQNDGGCQRIYYSRISPRSNYSEQDSQYWYGSESYQCWVTGERERIAGNIDQAIQFFDQAKDTAQNYEGAMPTIYESYAKAYRKLKDYTQEISVLDEAIQHCNDANISTEKFEARKKRAIEIQASHQRKADEEHQRAMRRDQRAEHRRQEAELVKAKPKKSSGRAVVQYADDGIAIIKEFPSIAAAERETGINSKSIRCAATGTQKHAGGYRWKYRDSDS
mgnify:CR=1 FL=1